MSEEQKIVRSKTAPHSVDVFTRDVARALFDLETTSSDLRDELVNIQIHRAVEIPTEKNRFAVVIYLPLGCMSYLQKIQHRLTRELEKKFSDRHVIFVPKLKIIPKEHRKMPHKQKRPRSRTLTAVRERISEFIVYPAEVVGKRTKIRSDGTRTTYCTLDKKDATFVEHKLDTFTSVYKFLTRQEMRFDFPAHQESASKSK